MFKKWTTVSWWTVWTFCICKPFLARIQQFYMWKWWSLPLYWFVYVSHTWIFESKFFRRYMRCNPVKKLSYIKSMKLVILSYNISEKKKKIQILAGQQLLNARTSVPKRFLTTNKVHLKEPSKYLNISLYTSSCISDINFPLV